MIWTVSIAVRIRMKFLDRSIAVLNAFAGGSPTFLEMTNRHVAAAVVKLSLKNRKGMFFQYGTLYLRKI